MNIIGIIPSRFASTRLPGKPLAMIHGKSMIERVYRQASKSKSLSKVIVATDDQRIFDHVKSFGGEVMMTEEHHQSGTDRCAEVLGAFEEFNAVINIQGDEPFINPEQIDLLAKCFQVPGIQIGTLIKKIHDPIELQNSHIPKVTINHSGQALYFSRQIIPFIRDQKTISEWLQHHVFYKHIGIYGYKAEVLKEITKLPVSNLERSEGLEQLRWLEYGYTVQTAETDMETISIDTESDLQAARNLLI